MREKAKNTIYSATEFKVTGKMWEKFSIAYDNNSNLFYLLK